MVKLTSEFRKNNDFGTILSIVIGGINMNYWTKKSVELARESDYLDRLYDVYPTAPNPRRVMPSAKRDRIRNAFDKRDNTKLIMELIDWELFPIKDSFVAFLKRDNDSIERNERTIERISNYLYQMGFDEIIKKCTEPKESNRQIGPMFKTWVDSGALGVRVLTDENDFLNCEENCVFNNSDQIMKEFAENYLGFDVERNKGIDFIAKFNDKYVFAETKFLTDFGGHQDAQFTDAVLTMSTPLNNIRVNNEVIPIAIMDGVLYIEGNSKMHNYLKQHPDQVVISSLLLKDFLNSL